MEEEPKVDETVEKLKIKKKPKQWSETNEDIKLDLTELKEKAEEITKVDLSEKVEEKVEKPQEKTETEKVEEIVLEEVTDEVKTPKPPEQPELPEGIQKVVEFMKETGGDLNDYINLNQDYSSWDNDTLLREYYNKTKPHLNNEEISFLIEDQFNYNANVDDEKEVKRKKLALKEQVAQARQHLDGEKSKYYEEIKMGSKLTEEQQNAIEFFNQYNKESQKSENATNVFLEKTNEVFGEDFKGFEYTVGDKRYRFNVKDTDKIKTSQSDINNFIKKFLNENNEMSDAAGYHKSLYTAMNADAIANHFYEQGKADALKSSIAKSKNIDMSPRQQHGAVETSGMKFKVLDDTSNYKFKIKKKN